MFVSDAATLRLDRLAKLWIELVERRDLAFSYNPSTFIVEFASKLLGDTLDFIDCAESAHTEALDINVERSRLASERHAASLSSPIPASPFRQY